MPEIPKHKQKNISEKIFFRRMSQTLFSKRADLESVDDIFDFFIEYNAAWKVHVAPSCFIYRYDKDIESHF